MTAEHDRHDTRPVLDVEDVAALLKCSPAHIRALVARGEFPAPAKLGALARWERESILAFVAGRAGRANRGGKLVELRG